MMAIVENKATARSYYEQVLNQGNMSAAEAIFAPDIQFHYPLGDLSGADTVKGFLAGVRTAFPDIHFAVADLVAEGNSVAARWTLTGTQTGELSGRAPTGQRVSVPGIAVFHVVNGKIHEMWTAFDPARLMRVL
jgi:steroid delta-isomerase-like uncharacterized protein